MLLKSILRNNKVMNLKNILNEIEKINPEVFERLSERRSILKSMGKKQ